MVDVVPAQDGWKIETRKRLAGKSEGSTYKVFIDPNQKPWYSKSTAVKNGFDPECLKKKTSDGNKKQPKKQAKKGKKN